MIRNSFLGQFFKKWKEVGAVSPSSVFLVEDMLSEIDFSTALFIVELGAGSGSFTKYILKMMRPDARLLVFEINDAFNKKLFLIKDSRMTLVNDSAVNLLKYLNDEKADHVVSGIPLSNLEKEVKMDIISAARAGLKPGGSFLQFQYLPESLSFLKKYFPSVRLKFTLLNNPPAFFYICR